MLEDSGASSTGNTGPLNLTKSGKAKKVSDRKGKPTANGDFIKKISTEHAAELKAFKDASEKKQGAHMIFVTNYRNAHEDEYKAFVDNWKETHSEPSNSETASTAILESVASPVALPVTSSVASSVALPVALSGTSSGTSSVASSVTGPTKKPVKKAQKAQEKPYTPVVQPIANTITEELLPFTMGGMTYLRTGYQRPDGNHLWTSGYLWLSKKGAKGAYIGQIQADGVIDPDVDEPSA